MTHPIIVYSTPRRAPAAYKLPWRAVYTPSVGERICDEVAGGRVLEQIAIEEPWAPSIRTIDKWRHEHPEFNAKYQAAVHLRAEKMAQEILEVADDLQIDPEDRKVMIAARQWLAGKISPKDWGERKIIDQNVTATIKSVQELDVSHLTLAQVHAAEAALLTVIEGVEVVEDDDDDGTE